MTSWSKVCDLNMPGHSIPFEVVHKRLMIVGIKAGVQMQRHDVITKWNNPLATTQHFKHDPAVHTSRYGNPNTRTRPYHARPLHGLARTLDANLLGIGKLVFSHQDNRILKSS